MANRLRGKDTGEVTDAEIRGAVEVLQQAGHERLQAAGWNLVRNHFYEPIVEIQTLRDRPHTWAGGHTTGIDWNPEHQLEVAREATSFIDELSDVPEKVEPKRGVPTEFCWDNNWWTKADPVMQYGLVRARKPKRYIEIGCGVSSLVLARALRANGIETGVDDAARPGGCEVTLVDPSEKPGIWEYLPQGWSKHRALVQDADLTIFDTLEAGDILFYDGSHCVKTGSDVNWMVFRVMPRLKPGVLVHFHDIFLPLEYPTHWLFEMHKSWNEQYLLQALLMHSDMWRIEIANAYLGSQRQDEFAPMFKGIVQAFGGSIWLKSG